MPNVLFYNKKSSNSSYEKFPPGLFTVTRLINHRPHWKKLSPSEDIKHKTLILFDWTARVWSEKKNQAVHNKMLEMLADGFTILLWNEGSFLPLTPNSITLLNDKIILPFCTTQDLKEAAIAQKKVGSVDEVYVLGHHEICCLVEGKDFSDMPYLNLSDLLKIKKEIDVISILAKEKMRLPKIIHDEFSVEANDFIENLSLNFKELIISPNYRQLQLKEEYYGSKFQWPYFLRGRSFSQDQLTFLESIEFSLDEGKKGISLKELHQLLENTSNLKTLLLNASCDDSYPMNPITGEKYDVTFNLPLLEELSIDADRFEGEAIKELISSSSSSLKKLQVKTRGIYFDKPLGLPSFLEELYLEGGFSANSLKNIVDKMEQIKKLYLSSTGKFSGFSPLLRFSQLEELTLGKFRELPFIELKTISEQSSCLKVLNLLGCKNVSLEKPLDFSALESLHLQEISCPNIAPLLSNSSQLKTLIIEGHEKILDLDKLDLPKLEIVKLQQPTSFETVQILLNKNQSIKELELLNCQGQYGNLNIKTLVNLKVLEISCENLEKMLLNTSSLEILNVTCSSNKDFKSTFCLSSLKKVAITDISFKNLHKLLGKATSLRELRLRTEIMSSQVEEKGEIQHSFHLPCLRRLLEFSHLSGY